MLIKSFSQHASSFMAIALLVTCEIALAQNVPTLNQIVETAQSGRVKEAQQMLQQALIVHPKSAKAYLLQAELALSQGQSELARESLAKAESFEPGLPFAKPEAVQRLRSRIETIATNETVNTLTEPTLKQVIEAAQAGRVKEAQQMVQRLLTANPNSAQAHYVQAELAVNQGQQDLARESLAKAEKIAPGLPFAKPESVQRLRGLVEKTAQVQQTLIPIQPQVPANTTTNSSASVDVATRKSPKVLIDSYCDRINSSQFISKISDFSKKFKELNIDSDIQYELERRDSEIIKWVSEKLKTDFEIDVRRRNSIEDNRVKVKAISDAINNCAKISTNKPFGTFLKEVTARPKVYGFNVNLAAPFFDRPNLFDVRENVYWLLFLPDGSEELLSSLYPNLMAQLDNKIKERIVLLDQQRKIAAVKQAEINERNQRSEREAKDREEIRNIENAFASSPDGQLVSSYQNFQIIQLCYDLRKDFAIKFIGPSDFTEYRSKIKRIEQTLEKKTKEKDTKKLFDLAEKRNRNFDASNIGLLFNTDAIEAITNNAKGSNWVTAKTDCDWFASRFRNNVEEILGKEAIKKSF